MKALEIGEAYQVAFRDIAEPVMQPGDILLKIKYIGLCGSDLSSYRGLSSMVKYPVIPGHEISAEVVEIGSEVPADFAKPGDLATVVPYFGCGKCTACRKNRSNACRYNETLGVQRNGALTEYISVPYEHVLICSDIAPEKIALIEPLSVGYHLSNRLDIQKGENVSVFGCGVIGLGAVAAAAFKGGRVIGVDVSDTKLGMAKTMGAAEGVFVENAVEDLMKLTGNDGVDVAVECSGAPAAFVNCLNAVCFAGRMGVISYTTKDVTFNTKPIVSKELNLYGSRNAKPNDFAEVLGMIRSGTVPVENLITKVFPLDEAEGVFDYWEKNRGEVTKILIRL